MSKDETIVQWIKIMLGVLVFATLTYQLYQIHSDLVKIMVK
jgi:hypothetical protein